MASVIEIEEFLEKAKTFPIIDVRTAAEFEQGHIPGAFNIPLFTNEERAIVGTLYKKTGRQEAIKKGLEIFGPRMMWYLEELGKILDSLSSKKSNTAQIDPDMHQGDKLGGPSLRQDDRAVCVHCWRGGMRSSSMAWLFELYGYKVYLLKQGYKRFRNLVLEEFPKERKLIVVGGRTGSAKTLVIEELKKLNQQVIDLEKLAHHKGSSFGAIGETPPPSQEMFENELGFELINSNKNEILYLEDESKLIGHRIIPKPFYEKMRLGKVIYCAVPFEERAKYITEHYGKYPKEDLLAATERILKKIDTRYSKDAIRNIEEGNYLESFKISLKYYDKTYDFGLSKRLENTVIKIEFDQIDPKKMAEEIVRISNNDSDSYRN